MSIPLLTLSVLQGGLSILVLNLASLSIPKLQKYEEKSKKAAEYSQAAADQLRRTRTTQASAVVAAASTLISAIIVAVTSPSDKLSTPTKTSLCLGNLALCIFANAHIKDFWNAKAKVPLVQDYNDAIDLTNQMAMHLVWLAGSWGLGALVSVCGW